MAVGPVAPAAGAAVAPAPVKRPRIVKIFGRVLREEQASATGLVLARYVNVLWKTQYVE